MLAAEFLDRRESPLDFFLARRVDIECFEITRQLARGLANLDGCFVHQRHHFREALVDARQSADAGKRARCGCVRIALVGIVEQRDGRLRGLGETPAIGMARALLGELRRLRPP